MTCDQAERAIQAYLEHDMASADRRAFEEHLGACGTCQEGLKAYRELFGMLRGLETVEVEADFVARVLSAVHRPFLPAAWVAVAAGLSLLLVLVLGAAALQLIDPDVVSPVGNLIMSAALSLKALGFAIGGLIADGGVLLRIFQDTMFSISPVYWLVVGAWVIAFDLFCGWMIRRLGRRVST